MARVKRGVTSHAKHKKVLKAAKGYYGRRKNTIRVAKQAVEKANQYAFRDRKRKKRTFRALWIQRLNEAVRIAALGKSGSVSALLKTLGTMTADERKQQGPQINGLKDRLGAAITARRETLKTVALDQRLNTETVDVTLPVRESPAEVG